MSSIKYITHIQSYLDVKQGLLLVLRKCIKGPKQAFARDTDMDKEFLIISLGFSDHFDLFFFRFLSIWSDEG